MATALIELANELRCRGDEDRSISEFVLSEYRDRWEGTARVYYEAAMMVVALKDCNVAFERLKTLVGFRQLLAQSEVREAWVRVAFLLSRALASEAASRS